MERLETSLPGNMKKLLIITLLAFTSLAFAEPTHPLLTIQQECDLYNAISALDLGCIKVIDGKPQSVPFLFPGSVRFSLSIDASLVRPKVDAYAAATSATRGRLDPKSEKTNATEEAVTKELYPIFHKIDADTPVLQKISLADLNLDSNFIPIQILVALKPIIQE